MMGNRSLDNRDPDVDYLAGIRMVYIGIVWCSWVGIGQVPVCRLGRYRAGLVYRRVGRRILGYSLGLVGWGVRSIGSRGRSDRWLGRGCRRRWVCRHPCRRRCWRRGRAVCRRIVGV